MPLNAAEKRKNYTDYQVPIGNMIRKIERLSVQHASHREIETVAKCLHTKLNDLRKELKMPFRGKDMDPSVYGENADK